MAQNAPMDLGRVGIWTASLDLQPIEAVPGIAAELEGLGYGALWLPEVAGPRPAGACDPALGGTERLVLATGIANIYGRDALRDGVRLEDASPTRSPSGSCSGSA